jgi:hypothetical protein
MIRNRALVLGPAIIVVAGLLSACTATETRTPARIVMTGPADKVMAQATPATQAMHAQLLTTPGKVQGTVEATLILPPHTAGYQAFTAMSRCIDAKLSCAFHGGSVKREVRASLG